MPPRRPEMVPGDHHLRPLADDVTTQPDPRPTSKLQSQSDGFPECVRDTLREARRLQHDEQATRQARERGETMEAVRDAGRPVTGRSRPVTGRSRPVGARVLRAENRGQIHQEHVHRPALQDRTRDAETFLQRLRRQDHEPLQPDAARNGLNGIEGAGQVQPGDDGAAGLGLRDQAQRQGGLAAGCVSVHGDAGQPGNAARPQDGVQGSETGTDDAPVMDLPRAIRRPIVERPGCRLRLNRPIILVRPAEWNRGESADRACLVAIADRPRSCRTPASLERGESGSDLGRGSGHSHIIEHMFDSSMRPSALSRTSETGSGGHPDVAPTRRLDQ